MEKSVRVTQMSLIEWPENLSARNFFKRSLKKLGLLWTSKSLICFGFIKKAYWLQNVGKL